jgi:hypothetical protein
MNIETNQGRNMTNQNELIELTQHYFKDIGNNFDNASHSLNKIIDSLTDEDNKPLKHVDSRLVDSLKNISYFLYQQIDAVEEDCQDIVETIKDAK